MNHHFISATMSRQLIVCLFGVLGLGLSACHKHTDKSPSTDTTPPTIVSTSPADNAVDVVINGTVTVTFSKAMDCGTLSDATFQLETSGSAIPGNVTCSSSSAIFTPSADLLVLTKYTATITKGIKDLAGNALATDYAFSFTTVPPPDTTPPTVVSTVPTDNATDVAPSAAISVNFSEAVDCATLNTSTFTVAGSAVVAGEVSCNGSSATFTPTSNLTDSMTYTASLSTGIKDKAGNALSQQHSWSFTTAASAVAPEFTLHPADITVSAPATATFNIAVTGVPLPTLQWQLSTDNGANWSDISGATATSYTTPATVASDNGHQFRVIASNIAGTTTSTAATLIVNVVSSTNATLVSATPLGDVANAESGMPSVSADGRFVAFISGDSSMTTNLVDDGYGGGAFLRDMNTGTISRINVQPDGSYSPGKVIDLKLSANGRYAMFTTFANDIVAGDTNIACDVFLRDLQVGVTIRQNVLPDGAQDSVSGNGTLLFSPNISADGRWLLMWSAADLAGDGSYIGSGLFLRDTQASVIRRVDPAGTNVVGASLSGNGQFVAYIYASGSGASYTHNLAVYDVLHDTTNLIFQLSALTPNGLHRDLSISDDGRFVAVSLVSPTLVGGAAASNYQVAVIDRSLPDPVSAMELVSVTDSGDAGTGGSSTRPQLSADGRLVLFASQASNLRAGATFEDTLLIRDRYLGTTQVVSRRVDGSPASGGLYSGSEALSRDASSVVFMGQMQNIVDPTATGGWQIFRVGTPAIPWAGTRQLGVADSGTTAYSVATDSAGSVYVTGATGGGLDGNTHIGNDNVFLTKYNSSGVKLFTRQIGAVGVDVDGYAVAVDGGDNVFVSGVTGAGLDGNSLNGLQDCYIIKYNTKGVMQNTWQFGVTDAYVYGCYAAIDANGNIYVAGYTDGGLDGNTLVGTYDMFVTKYNSTGVKQYTRQLGVSGAETTGHSVATDVNGNVYVAGYTNGGLDGNTLVGTMDFFVTKYNSNGVKQYTRQLGVAGANASGWAVATDGDGNIFVVGSTTGGLDGNVLTGTVDAFVTKYDSSGAKQYTRQLGESGAKIYGTSVSTDVNGNVYVAGHTDAGLDNNTLIGNIDTFVAKYDGSGIKQFTRQLGVAGAITYGYAVVTDKQGNAFVAGQTNGGLDDNVLTGKIDFFVTKYNSSGSKQ